MSNSHEELTKLVNIIKFGDFEQRKQAATALGAFGDKAASVVPDLIECLIADPCIAESARMALSAVGATSVHILAEAFTKSSSPLKVGIVDALGKGRLEFSKPAIPILVSATKDQDSKVRRFAAQSLARIFSRYSDKITEQEFMDSSANLLASLLDHQDTEVRDYASLALMHLGSKVIPVIHKITEVLRLNKDNPNKDYQSRLIAALGNAGQSAHCSVDLIKDFLTDSEWIIRNTSVIAIGKIGTDSELIISKLRDRLADSKQYIRLSAIYALMKLNYPFEFLLETVTNLLSDRDSLLLVGCELIGILKNAGSVAKLTLPILDKLVNELTHYENDTETPKAQLVLETRAAVLEAITTIRASL